MNATKQKLAIIGWPVTHSRSPLIHNHWIGRLGLNAVYEYYPISPEADFAAELEAMQSAGFIGANVTIPHKETAFRAMQKCSRTAVHLGAVNVIKFTANGPQGANTDGEGFVAGLDEHHRDWRNHPAFILGAGGAARAIIVALAAAGVVDVRLANRSRAHAEAAAEIGRAAGATVTVFDWDAHEAAAAGIGLLVNATSLGMVGHNRLDMRLDNLSGHVLVSDIVYTPLDTPLLQAARRADLQPIDGLGMLMHQAASAFEIWFGQRPPVDASLRTLLRTDLGE